jgi:hypothetical protein
MPHRVATISIVCADVRGARTLAALFAVGCALVAPAAARAIETVDDAPGAASRGPGQVEVFVRGPTGNMLQSSLTAAGTWTAWQPLDGGLSSGPAATGIYGPGRTDVWVRGLDQALYHRWELGSAWTGWEDLGGVLQSAPTVEVRRGSPSYIDVYARWADNAIMQDSYIPGSGWTGWLAVPGGGLTLSAPAVASRAAGYVDVVVRGTNDGIYVNEWNGSAWSNWVQIGGGTQSAPALVSRSIPTLDLFVRDGNGQIEWRTFNGLTWSGYTVLPGVVDSGPAATTDGAGRIYLFARSGGDIVVNVFNGSTWSGWQPIHPPPPPPPPPPACTPAAGTVSAKARTVRYGRRPRVTGRATAVGGQPLAGASLQAATLRGAGEATAVTRADGRFALKLPRGHDRMVRFIVPVPALHALACSAPISVRVRAGVRLSASRTAVPGGRIRFSGRLLGKPIPRHGKLIELQAYDGGRWRTFATPRAHHHYHGRFHATYHLRHTFGPRTFRFRARVRREAAYPYVEGYSKSIRVRVR